MRPIDTGVVAHPCVALRQDVRMSISVHDVLHNLRASALDERDKGDKFERLVLNLLRTEPE